MGVLTRIEASAPVLSPVIAAYSKVYGVDLAEAEVPSGGFQSFDAFFTRRLRAGARPIDPDAKVLVSPADGRIEDAGTIEKGGDFLVKGKRYDVAELVGDGVDARAFEGGAFAIVYLSPRDYHRVHAPVLGAVRRVRHIGGTLYPVNAIGLEHIPRLFARNERVAVFQRSAVYGEVATVLVGAIGVGRITISVDAGIVTNDRGAPSVRDFGETAPTLERGDELGVFHMGSTAIVLVEGGRKLTFARGAGETVRMGEALLRVGSGS